jgi:hypothetical protein
MRQERLEKRQQARTLPAMRAELEQLRDQTTESSTNAEMLSLRALEQRVREEERREAIIWRRHSRIKWLFLGEAPSCYFFAQMRGKQVWDTIHSLKDSSDRIGTTDTELIQTVYDNFKTTYTSDPEVLQNHEERAAVLIQYQALVTAEENAELQRAPTNKEIRDMVFKLKKETSPGMDGLTSETLQNCWDFIEGTCCKLVQDFWQGGSLPRPMLAAIIKLLYKGGEKVLLKNWHPISLLNVPYKLVAKLITNRMKGILPRLVDQSANRFCKRPAHSR